MRSVALSLILACMVAACRSVGGSSTMYPEPVHAGAAVKGDTAVVLVGNGGGQTIDYLQFIHSGFPAINARGINLPPDGIVAIPVPVGTTGLQLSNYTAVGRPGTYLPNGMSSGFVRVNTPGIDISSPGLYYVATIFPGQPRNFELKPTAAQLIKLRKDRPELADLKPVNFNWSN